MEKRARDIKNNILTVNCGSSSVRLAIYGLLDGGMRELAKVQAEVRPGMPTAALQSFVHASGVLDLDGVAHRIVHGGQSLVSPCLINDRIESEIRKYSALAPLHNAVSLDWVAACRDVLGNDISQVAVFDTAFFADLLLHAQTYALPIDMNNEFNIRRFGFHGLAHEDMLRQWCAMRPKLKKGGRVISLQLGSGCSAAAIKHGKPMDTSMGFSPLEGLVMATRPGDIDSGLLFYLQRHCGLDCDALEHILNTKSGLKGLSGTSGDIRDLLASESEAARLAIDVYCYRVRKYIGAYLAALNGADAILFGGGVGEHAPRIRAKILAGLDWFGIRLDADANKTMVETGGLISLQGQTPEIHVMAVDEARVLAREGSGILTFDNKSPLPAETRVKTVSAGISR